MTQADRRRSPRKAADLPVRCLVDGRSFPGRLRDICRDAALIDAHERLPLDTRVVLTVELPSAGTVDVAGRVIRHVEGEGDAKGMAILFTGATPAAATRIDLFLSREE